MSRSSSCRGALWPATLRGTTVHREALSVADLERVLTDIQKSVPIIRSLNCGRHRIEAVHALTEARSGGRICVLIGPALDAEGAGSRTETCDNGRSLIFPRPSHSVVTGHVRQSFMDIIR